MDVTLSEDQELYRRAVRTLLRREHPTTAAREAEASRLGYLPELYRRLGELGYLGLLVPEEHGGSDSGWLTAALFHEEAGRVLLTGPVLASCLAARALTLGGSQSQQARLSQLAAGREVIVLAVAEADGTADPAAMATRAERKNGGWIIRGEKQYVPYADSADALIVAARTEDAAGVPAIGLFLVEAGAIGLATRSVPVISGERYCSITLDGVEAAPIGDPAGGAALLDTLLQESAILDAARAVGSAAELLDMAVEYSKGRVQFGRPIGAFQALQHMMADLATEIDGARLLVYQAAWQRDEGEAWEHTASLARLCAAKVFQLAARTCHQIHGGYGFIMITDVQLYVRRAKLSEVDLTGAEVQRNRIAEALGI